MQVVEVQNKDSRQVTYIVVASESHIDLFSLDISGGVPSVVHQKKLNIKAHNICNNMEEPSKFFIANKNTIAEASIDLTKDQRVFIASKKIKYSDNSSDRTTAIKSTFLRGDFIPSQTQTDSIMAIAYKSSDDEHFNLAIMKKTEKFADFSMVEVVQDCHGSEITQILALTDFYCKLSFVTMSLDGYIKIFSDEGKIEREIMGLGQALNGSVMPNRQDYFIVSTQNEETEENFVCVYRR